MESPAQKRILFLGYDENQTSLISRLREKGCLVDVRQSRLAVDATLRTYDLIVSFGYRHLVSKDVLQYYGKDIVNLHVSYLPWNKGAHPNFWAFFDGAPHGVTIHLMVPEVDAGPILYQRRVHFDAETTFSQTYARLLTEIEALFVENMDDILNGRYRATPQRGKGTAHRAADLPAIPGGWDADIGETLSLLRKQAGTSGQATRKASADGFS